MRIRQRAVALYFIDKVNIIKKRTLPYFSLSFPLSSLFVLVTKKTKMKPTQSVVVHYVLNMSNYTIESKVLVKILSNLIFLVKIALGKIQRLFFLFFSNYFIFRYTNKVSVESRVYKNLKLFIENKDEEDELFDRLTVINKPEKNLFLIIRFFYFYRQQVLINI
jgi:hypothetical protein